MSTEKIALIAGVLTFSHIMVAMVTRLVVRSRAERERIRHADRLLQSMPRRQ